MTLLAGLCSVTFRQLTPDEVLAAAQRAGIDGIEWGADRHVRPGDLKLAADIARRGRDAGIQVVSYGSYLGVAGGEAPDEIDRVLDTADALGTDLVRVWAELGVTPTSPGADQARVRDQTMALAAAAAARGIDLALEFHPGTLTHTAAATNDLLRRATQPNLRTHWQPDPALTAGEALAELRLVLPHLAHLHVFLWGPTGGDDRRALAEGGDLWPAAIAIASGAATASAAGSTRYALCEFVRDDSPDQFLADAAVLHGWINAL